MKKKKILARLIELRKRDPFYDGGKILSSVCTQPSEISLEAYRIYADVNALDTHVFPNTWVLESEVIKWFDTVLGGVGIAGYITSGGTEANIQALWAAKKKYPDRKTILVPKSAHYSIEKAADLLELSIEWVPLDEKYKADVGFIEQMISDDTLAVVLTAGTSALGVVDPIMEVSGLCSDVFLHVDAAFGGMVLPFLNDSPRIDFGLENIDSVTLDPHKMGCTPIPSGCILFRDKSYMSNLVYDPSYLKSPFPSLIGSRSAGFIAAVWANLMFYDVEGYRRIVGECMENTRLLLSHIDELEGLSPVVEPELNFVALTGEYIKEVHDMLVERGWRLLLDRDSDSFRVVVMPHVTADVVRAFVGGLRECVNSIR